MRACMHSTARLSIVQHRVTILSGSRACEQAMEPYVDETVTLFKFGRIRAECAAVKISATVGGGV